MKKWIFFASVFMLVLFLTACGNNGGQSGYSNSGDSDQKADNGNEDASGDMAKDMGKLQLLNHDKVGEYLADGEGMTLYYFTKDEKGESYCTGKCLDNWPSFHAKNLKVPEGFEQSDFGTITREDNGKPQTTYKGYPLYYYTPDQKKGDVKGQNVNDSWYIVNTKTTFKEGQHESKDLDEQKDNNSY